MILTIKDSSLPPTSSNFREGYCSSGDLALAEKHFTEKNKIKINLLPGTATPITFSKPTIVNPYSKKTVAVTCGKGQV